MTKALTGGILLVGIVLAAIGAVADVFVLVIIGDVLMVLGVVLYFFLRRVGTRPSG